MSAFGVPLTQHPGCWEQPGRSRGGHCPHIPRFAETAIIGRLLPCLVTNRERSHPMRNLPVFWHEGMFLRPQHFQAADRYWSELHEVSQQLDHPYYYGLRTASLSEEAIANNQFQINACRARMKDGTVINLEIGQEPDRLDMREAVSGLLIDSADLGEAFEQEARVRVFLAVPRLKLGRANVGRDHSQLDSRFLTSSSSVQDETDGSNQEEVDFLTLNTRLLLSTQSHAGFEVMPIAQVKRAGGGLSGAEDEAVFIPEVLYNGACAGLT